MLYACTFGVYLQGGLKQQEIKTKLRGADSKQCKNDTKKRGKNFLAVVEL